MKLTVIALLLLLLAICGCSSDSGVGSDGDSATGIVYLWIAADKDAYTTCGRTGGCEEGDHNHGTDMYLIVADWELANKRSYVHFLTPIFPEGTEIMEAYLELYHDAANEDGKTDDVNIPVMRLSVPFDPNTLTWNTQPVLTTGLGSPSISLRSQDWSGTADISGFVEDMIAYPDNDFGFVIFWNFVGLGIEKGFHANNHIHRTALDLAKTPRLLVKIKLPAGKSTDDITLPPMSADNDLDFDGEEVLMLLFRSGTNWPEDWEVAAGAP